MLQLLSRYFQIPLTQATILQSACSLADGGLALPHYPLIHKGIHDNGRDNRESNKPDVVLNEIHLARWRELGTSSIHSRYIASKLPAHSHFSWLAMLPTNRHFVLPDNAFLLPLHLRLGVLQPFPLINCTGPKETQSFADHVFTCYTCATAGFNIRHEAAVAALGHAATQSHISSSTNVDNLPVPAQAFVFGRRCGPDRLFYNPVTTALDMTITHQTEAYDRNQAARAIKMKDRKYNEWATLSNIQCLAVHMTTLGAVHESFFDYLDSIAKDLGTSAKTIRRTFALHLQASLCHSIASSMLLLRARSVLTTTQLARHPSPPDA